MRVMKDERAVGGLEGETRLQNFRENQPQPSPGMRGRASVAGG